MSSGQVDFAAGAFNNLTTGFFQNLVLRERHVCIVRSSHPRFRAGMSLEAFTEAGQVLADATGMATTAIIDRFLSKHRVRRNVVLRVPHFHVLPAIVADSDLLAIIPKRLADAFASRLPIKLLYCHLPLRFPRSTSAFTDTSDIIMIRASAGCAEPSSTCLQGSGARGRLEILPPPPGGISARGQLRRT